MTPTHPCSHGKDATRLPHHRTPIHQYTNTLPGTYTMIPRRNRKTNTRCTGGPRQKPKHYCISAQLTPRSMPPLARRNCNRWMLPASSCSDSIVPGLARTSRSAATGSFLAGGAPFFPPPLQSRLPCKRPPFEPLTNASALSKGCATAERRSSNVTTYSRNCSGKVCLHKIM